MKNFISFKKTVQLLLILLFAVLVFPLHGAGANEEAQIITTWPARERLVALTFDAGSDYGIAGEIMDILAEYDARATFFLTGQWLEIHAEAAKRIPREGHALGNHSYTHPDFTELSDNEIRSEVARVEELAQEILGTTLRPYFRPPFGAYDARILRILAEEGYDYSVMWTVDSLDWKGISAKEMLGRVVDGLRPGTVILLHVGSGTNTAEALPLMLDHFVGEGYQTVTLDELIASTGDATVYTVRSGDTLYGIAGRFGVSAGDLQAFNPHEDLSNLQIGQMLYIPNGTAEAPADEEEPDETDGDPDPDEEDATRDDDEDADDAPDETVEPGGEEGAGREEIPITRSPFRVLLDVVTQVIRVFQNLMVRLFRWIFG